jgi:outer membrane protein assembly factor BamB
LALLQPITRIPLTQPTLLFEAAPPDPYTVAQARPVIAGDVLLCLGSSARPLTRVPLAELPPSPDTPVLVALDGVSGTERFRLEVPTRACTREVTTSLSPTVRADGSILLAVYQQDVSLSVFALSPAGRVLWEDELGRARGVDRLHELRLRAFDLYIKHWFSQLVAGPADGYLAAWLYRQERFAHLEYRQGGQVVWQAPEWLVGHGGEVVLGASVPRASSTLTARVLTTGRPLWSLSGKERVLAAAEADFLLFVSRPPTRAEAALTAPRSAGNMPPRIALAGRHCPPIVAHDPATGEVLWSIAVPGSVVSLACGPAHIAALALAADNQAVLVCADRQGQTLWTRLLPPIPNEQVTAWQEQRAAAAFPWPLLIAVDDASLLWESGSTLHCAALRDGTDRWQLATPEAWAGFLPRIEDRLLGISNTQVGDGVIYRRGTRLWAYASPPRDEQSSRLL